MLSLEAFINDKVKNYIAPEKEGVPKGDEIGFSKKKHHASLLILRMDSLKEIANKVKAPYGTARNWKTDKGFKQESKRHADEFAKNAKLNGVEAYGPVDAHGERIYYIKTPSGVNMSFQSKV